MAEASISPSRALTARVDGPFLAVLRPEADSPMIGYPGGSAFQRGREMKTTRFFRAARHGLLAAMLGLAGCQSVDLGLPGSSTPAVDPIPAILPAAKGEVIGSGPVRVAMLLPGTAPGNGAKIATDFRNAAAMAMEDFGAGKVELVIKDTQGLPGPTADVASEAVQEGASVVLGPLFSGNVTAASGILQPSGRLMIAFSSDRNAARPGVYLQSFMPEAIIDRTLAYATSQGVRDVVAILPNGAFGILAEAQARKSLEAAGGRLVAAVRYDYNDTAVDEAVRQAGEHLAEAQAIFIPDGGTTPGAIIAAFTRNGVEISGKRLLGSGQWTTADLANPALNGAWFADIDQSRVGGFVTRYQAKYGAEPSANAALAYDAVALVTGLAGQGDAAGITREMVESPSGFNGYTGIFRFRPDGTNERGFAVYEVQDAKAVIVSAAPTSFAPGL